jgi:hypothetical protein
MDVAGPFGTMESLSELRADSLESTLEWRQLAGDLRVWAGSWRLIDRGVCTEIQYRMEMRLNVYLPGFLIRRALTRGITRLLYALEARAIQTAQSERRLTVVEHP